MKSKMALIGFGYWGKNLLRNLVSSSNCEVVGVVDQDAKKLKNSNRASPQVPTFSSINELLEKTKVEGVIIATPPATHYEIAKFLLEKNISVCVEKPLTFVSDQAEDLIQIAKKNNSVLMVDHTYVYTPAVQYISEYIKSGHIGKLLYFDSVRINLGGFQPEANVLWDLAPHDLSILDQISGGIVPEKVSCVGVNHFDNNVINMCYLTLFYPNNFISHVHLNWAAPVKMRQILIGGSKGMIIFDDNAATEKVKLYDTGIKINNNKHDYKINYRVGDMIAPNIAQSEALANMIEEFTNSITNNKTPKTCGEAGKRVVEIIEAASKSLEKGGEIVVLK